MARHTAGRASTARTPRGVYLACVAAPLLFTTLCVSSLGHSEDPLETHRYESLACALDHFGAPLAWGFSSAIRTVDAVNASQPLSTAAEWLSKSLAAAYFLPVNECASPRNGNWTSDVVFACSRATVYAVLHNTGYDYQIVAAVDEVLFGIGDVLFNASRLNLLLRGLQLTVILSAPWRQDETLIYFLQVQLTLAWESNWSALSSTIATDRLKVGLFICSSMALLWVWCSALLAPRGKSSDSSEAGRTQPRRSRTTKSPPHRLRTSQRKIIGSSNAEDASSRRLPSPSRRRSSRSPARRARCAARAETVS